MSRRKLPARHADGIAARMFGIKSIRWCNPGQLLKVVQALEIAGKRERAADAGAVESGSAEAVNE